MSRDLATVHIVSITLKTISTVWISCGLASVHIVSIHFLIHPLLYILPVFFHYLDHKQQGRCDPKGPYGRGCIKPPSPSLKPPPPSPFKPPTPPSKPPPPIRNRPVIPCGKKNTPYCQPEPRPRCTPSVYKRCPP
nr:hypothetical protein CFP56_37665 [Quercus suber]